MTISSSITYPAALLFVRYSYQQDIATSKILLLVRHCFRQYWQPVGYDCWRNMTTSEIWLPVRYSCLDNISYNQMPNSSDLTFTAVLIASEIWLLQVPARYCSLWDIAPYEILLPMRYCSLWDIASYEILLPMRYCSLRDIATCKISLPARNG